jgi:hypothetical protein
LRKPAQGNIALFIGTYSRLLSVVLERI